MDNVLWKFHVESPWSIHILAHVEILWKIFHGIFPWNSNVPCSINLEPLFCIIPDIPGVCVVVATATDRSQ